MAPSTVLSPLWLAIERRMQALDINEYALAREAKINQTAVRDIRIGKSRNPRIQTLQKIAQRLGCTAGDLEREASEIDSRARKSKPVEHGAKNRAVQQSQIIDAVRNNPKTPQNQGFVTTRAIAEGESIAADAPLILIPEYDAIVGAGGGGLYEANNYNDRPDVVGHYAFPAEGFRQAFGAMPDQIVILSVVGDSMVTTLFPGQRVMVDLHDRTPSPPGLFVVFDGLTRVVKRIEYIADSEPPTIRIMSDNPRYTAYQRTLDEARIEGRVIGVWARL